MGEEGREGKDKEWGKGIVYAERQNRDRSPCFVLPLG